MRTVATRNAEQRIVLAIAALTRKHGFAPTFREIARECGYATPSVVVHHLRHLRDRGLVEWQDGKARSIRLVKQPVKRHAPSGVSVK